MAGDKILVVDDNEAARYVKSRVLQRAGYNVLQASNGRDALNLAFSEFPALILLDVSMPDMSGIDVCRQIKAREPTILILQTSAAFTGKQDRAAGLVGGADSYLVEPLEPEELRATVEALLRLRRAEQDLRSSHDTLEKQVDARTTELASANEKLREEVEHRRETETILRHAQRMDVIGQLTGGIAHDFNNLLAIILGNLEMLRRRLGPNADPQMLENADNAFFGARRAANLTRQLLSFSRRQSLAPKPIRFERMMAGLTMLLRQTLTERVTVNTEVTGDVWPVNADEGELEAAILNLAVNARDAMGGVGVITLSARNEPAAGGADDYVAIAIKDAGKGMSAEVLKFAFEPFFTTKDVGQGTGLGLSQVYGFATQAGGRVDIESAVGIGTTVTLRLPRYKGVIVDVAEDNDINSATHAQTVLVVEDNDHVRAQTVDMLQELGYRVIEAPTAKTALALAEQHKDIALLFTDVGLPGGMDGIELSNRMSEIVPHVKIVLTSGYAPSAPNLKTAQYPILAKPFTFSALGRALRDALGKPAAPVASARKSVLFVEDEAMIRLNAVEVLLEHGFQVEEAGTAKQALAIVAREPAKFGAAVIDVGLPDGRGDDLAIQFRAAYPDLVIVIASGDPGEKARAHFAKDPLTAFVDKPYNLDGLAARLRGLGKDL